MSKFIVFLLVFIVLLLAACVSPETPAPVVTLPSPSSTPTSTIGLVESHTPTLLPTATPTPSNTPTPTRDPYIISATNTHEIVELAQLGKGEIQQITWAPDGTFFAVSSATGISLYDGETMTEFGQLDVDWGPSPLAISPDGLLLVAPSADDFINLWEIETGQLLITLEDVAYSWSAFAFSPDGLMLAAVNWQNETVYLWEIATGKIKTTLQGITDDSVKGGIGTFASLAFSPDGHTLAAGRPDTRILLWDIDTGQLLHTLTWIENFDSRQEFGGYSAISFSSDGNLLADVSEGRGARVWNVETGQLLFTLEGEMQISGLYPPVYLAFNQEENTLLYGVGVAGRTGLIRSWEMDTGQLQNELEVTGVIRAISSNGHKFVSEQNGVLYLGDAKTGEILQMAEGYTNDVLSIAFSPDGTSLLSGEQGGVIRIWDVNDKSALHTIGVDTYWIFSLAYSPDGNTFITGEGRPHYLLRVWDSSNGDLLHSYGGHTETIFSVAFNSDGKTLASSGFDDKVLMWDIDQGYRNLVFDDLDARVLTFSPDGQKLIIGGRSYGGRDWDFENVIIFDPTSNQFIRTFNWVNRTVSSLAVSPDNQTVAIGEDVLDEINHYDGLGKVSIANLETGERVRVLMDASEQRPNSLAFDPSGQLLAIALDNTVQIWEVDSGIHLTTFETGNGYRRINSIVFSPNGQIIATGDTAGVIRFWGLLP